MLATVVLQVLLLLRKKDVTPKVTIEIDLSKISEKITTKEEILDYYLEYFGHEKIEEFDEYEKEDYEKCLKELELGKIIYIGRVSNEGEAQEEFLYDQGIEHPGSNFKVIQGVYS